LKNKNVKTSQIRNAYGNMKKLEMAGWQGKPHSARGIIAQTTLGLCCRTATIITIKEGTANSENDNGQRH
jgi:hypothetical protein